MACTFVHVSNYKWEQVGQAEREVDSGKVKYQAQSTGTLYGMHPPLPTSVRRIATVNVR